MSKRRFSRWALAPLMIAAAVPARASIFGAPKSAIVNVVVDFTPEGRKLAHPTPENPAYYLPVVAPFQQLGGRVHGEWLPDRAQLTRLAAVELAKQGYLVMKPGPYLNARNELVYADGTVITVPEHPRQRRPIELNVSGNVPLTWAMINDADGPYSFAAMRTDRALLPGAEAPPIAQVFRQVDPVHGATLGRLPSLILAIYYGYLNPQTESFAPGSSQIPINSNQMIELVAGATFAHLDFISDERQAVMEAIGMNRYFIAISAYDFRAFVDRRRKVLLWQAKMSVPSAGIQQLADVMDALIKAGGPHFGRPMDHPEQVALPVTPQGRVKVGTPTVKDDGAATPDSGR